MYPFFFVFILVSLLQAYGPATRIATIKNDDINESSGLVASHTSPGAYWTHNDSGDGPFIYAIDTRGQSLGTFRVTGATNRDWEDIASGPGPQPNRSSSTSAILATTIAFATKSSSTASPNHK